MGNCFNCGMSIAAGEEMAEKLGAGDFIFCPRCAPPGAKRVHEPAAPAPAPRPSAPSGIAAPGQTIPPTPVISKSAQNAARQTDEPQKYTMAWILGLAASALAGGLWYIIVISSHYKVGWIAIGVGFAIGFAVHLGADGQNRLPYQIIAVALTLIAMLGSEYFIVRQIANEYLISQGETGLIPLFTSPDVAFELIVLSVKASPLTIVFWLVSLGAAFRVPGGYGDN